MAKSKSTKSPPLSEVIAWRVEAQRSRVFQAQAICSIVSKAARGVNGTGREGVEFAQDTWTALEGVADMLDSIAGELESGVILDPEVTPDEEAKA